ncbi:Transposable element Tcb1 transposase, partial [Stegodyphus mimosarum]
MVWGAIAYHRRSQLLRIVGNLNSNRYIREVLQPEAVPFLQSLPGAVFQQDNARPHTARIVKSFFAAQQVQLLPWPACSPDMSPIEHVWDVIGRRLARDPRPVASADELWCHHSVELHQDKANSHTSKSTINFLEKIEQETGGYQDPFSHIPTKSPDH